VAASALKHLRLIVVLGLDSVIGAVLLVSAVNLVRHG
jgi:hypothetical protein